MLTFRRMVRRRCLQLSRREHIDQTRPRREVEHLLKQVAVEIGDVRMVPEAPFQEAKQAVDLTKADVIVVLLDVESKSKDNLVLAEKLAEALGGDLAASRPICDADWLPIDRQIGSSGQTVARSFMLLLGISGAIQHLVGMKELRNDCGYQQRSRSADIRYCGLRNCW